MILVGQLGLEDLHLSLELSLGRVLHGTEGRSAILEELPLPVVEAAWLEVME